MAERFFATERGRGLMLIALPFVYALLLLAVPIGAILLISFWSQDGLDIDHSLTLQNYIEVLQLPRYERALGAIDDPSLWERIREFFSTIYLQLLGRSVFVSATVTAVTVILAYPIAYFVSFQVRPERKALWIFLITIPFWTSYLIRVFLWKVILGYDGVINKALIGIGLIDAPLTAILYNVNSVIITLAHAYAPFAILPIYVALEKIDRSLLEAGQDLGEGKAMTFWRVTLPLSMPGLVAAVLIVFIPTIGDYVTPQLMGGSGGKLIANMIQTQFLKLNNAPLGAALSIIAMISVSSIALLFVFFNRRWLRGR